MTMTSDALALSYANIDYTSFGTDLAHLASDPFGLAHLASTATFGSSDDEDEDEDEDESAA